MGSEDKALLEKLASILGGTVNKRPGVDAYKLNVSYFEGVLALVHGLNGLIQNKKRIAQLEKVSRRLGVASVPQKPVGISYLAGLFDADGTIYLRDTPHFTPLLSIRISAKLLVDLASCQPILGGSYYYDKAGFGSWVWSVQSREDVLRVSALLGQHSMSNKGSRFHKVEEYFMLRDLKAYLPDSPHYVDWVQFKNEWNYSKV